MTPSTFKLGIAQLNPVLGDIAGNLALARRARAEAAARGADLVLFPELFLTGYPPEDLLLKLTFVATAMAAVEALAADTADGGPGVVIGCPQRTPAGLFNAVAVLDAGRILAWRAKVDLPRHGVADETRLFRPGDMPGPVNFRGLRLGIPFGSDIEGALGVGETLAESGADILLVPAASAFSEATLDIRHQWALRQVIETDLPVIYANLVGGQDELVFDGASFAFNGDRTLAFQLPAFDGVVPVIDWRHHGEAWVCTGPVATLPGPDEALWRAAVLGLRDHVEKNGYGGVVLDPHGDIGAAVAAAMAVDALGRDRVRAVIMPGRGIADDEGEASAAALRLRFDIVDISGAAAGFRSALAGALEGVSARVDAGRVEGRARADVLAAIAAANEALIVVAADKGAASLGLTAAADTGSFNPIKDLYRSELLRLAAWRNAAVPAGSLGRGGTVIPERIIAAAREPASGNGAETELPPHDVREAVLRHLLDGNGDADALVRHGVDAATVARIEHLLYEAEDRRRRAALGVRLTPMALSRRFPVTNRFGTTAG